jgi:hypothetical protein
VTVTGGTAPYGFSWSTGSTDSSIINLSPGSYDLTITDAAGCYDILGGVITGPDSVQVAGSVVNASCPSAGDGTIQLLVSGGTPGYTFVWSNGSTTQDISGLTPGVYSVTVTDLSGCNAFKSFTVNQNSAVCPNTTVTGVISGTVCYDATQTITVAGGGTVFTVEASGHVDFIAGARILFYPGTKVLSGGYMRGRILPAGPFCSGTKIAEVIAEEAPIPGPAVRTQFILYPNPTTGDFTIAQQGETLFPGFRVEVFSMKGELLLSEEVRGIKQEIRFMGRPAGIYMVRIWSERGVEARKVIVL